MAVTVADVTPAGNSFSKIFTVIATADADVAAVIPHGLGAVPQRVELIPKLAAYYTSAPVVGVVDATNVNLIMSAAAGSGAAGVQIQCLVDLPYSTVK